MIPRSSIDPVFSENCAWVLIKTHFVIIDIQLCRSLTVRLVKSSDIEQVESLCQGIDGSNQVIADIKQYLVSKRDPIDEVRQYQKSDIINSLYH